MRKRRRNLLLLVHALSRDWTHNPCSLTGNWTGDHFALWDKAQLTELHWSGWFLTFIQNVTYHSVRENNNGQWGIAPWFMEETCDRVELATILIAPPSFLTLEPNVLYQNTTWWRQEYQGLNSLLQSREIILSLLGTPAFLSVGLVQSQSYAAVYPGHDQTSVRIKTKSG